MNISTKITLAAVVPVVAIAAVLLGITLVQEHRLELKLDESVRDQAKRTSETLLRGA